MGHVNVFFMPLFLSFGIGLGGALGFIFFVLSVLCSHGALWLYKVVLPVFLYLFPLSLSFCLLFSYIGCFPFFIVLSFHSLGSLVQVLLGLLVDSK